MSLVAGKASLHRRDDSDGPTLPAQTFDVSRYLSFQEHFLMASCRSQMPIDHFGSFPGTYKHRWFYNDSYYQSGGPVFRMCGHIRCSCLIPLTSMASVFDSGQHNASILTDYLVEPNGYSTAIMRLAQRYHGLAVMLESRFFGTSTPFPARLTVGLSTLLRYPFSH
jgi:hypothetical protein